MIPEIESLLTSVDSRADTRVLHEWFECVHCTQCGHFLPYPLYLGCGEKSNPHTFCSGCLQKHFKQNSSFSCPECLSPLLRRPESATFSAYSRSILGLLWIKNPKVAEKLAAQFTQNTEELDFDMSSCTTF